MRDSNRISTAVIGSFDGGPVRPQLVVHGYPGLAGPLQSALLNLVQPEQNTKLYRSYVMDHGAGRVLRHRGKSPRQAAFFFRNAELNFHAAQLASLFLVYGLLGGSDLGVESHYRVGSLESGALLCQAYESYLEFHAPASISFEHAWFLLMALSRRDELGVARCVACGGVRLRDLLSKRRLICGNCDCSSFAAAAGDIGHAMPC